MAHPENCGALNARQQPTRSQQSAEAVDVMKDAQGAPAARTKPPIEVFRHKCDYQPIQTCGWEGGHRATMHQASDPRGTENAPRPAVPRMHVPCHYPMNGARSETNHRVGLRRLRHRCPTWLQPTGRSQLCEQK